MPKPFKQRSTASKRIFDYDPAQLKSWAQASATFGRLDDLEQALNRSLNLSTAPEQAHYWDELPPGVPALAKEHAAHQPWLTINSQNRRTDNSKLAFARGLGAWLLEHPYAWVLGTQAYANQQSLNRAFAAEFLMPASYLQQQITRKNVRHEYVEAFANDHLISSRVITNQLYNHNIASVSYP
jgi:hypothetical protein